MKETEIDFDRYIIYEDGRIFSKAKNDFMEETLNEKGYVYNTYKLKDGSFHRFRRHRVIWTYFNGEIPNNMQIDHKNTIRKDNCLSNIHIVDGKGQYKNPITKQNLINSHIGKPHYYQRKPVAQIDKTTGEIIKIWDCAALIEKELGFYNQNISKCCNGKRTTAYGFKWSFV